MMNADLYPAIFKRKSFHLFRNAGSDEIDPSLLEEIKKSFVLFERLYQDIRTEIRIVPAKTVNFKRDAEYCILIYSEKKENYLLNVGYVGEQLDLFLVTQGIGTLWFGIGKPDQWQYNGLDFVIMIAIRKINNPDLFRKDMFQSKRKTADEIWQGEGLGVAEIARFAPSACNTQPWYVTNHSNTLTVFRHQKPGKRGIMPAHAVRYYNRIDIGIFLCILEICFANQKIQASRTLFADLSEEEYSKVAEYLIL